VLAQLDASDGPSVPMDVSPVGHVKIQQSVQFWPAYYQVELKEGSTPVPAGKSDIVSGKS